MFSIRNYRIYVYTHIEFVKRENFMIIFVNVQMFKQNNDCSDVVHLDLKFKDICMKFKLCIYPKFWVWGNRMHDKQNTGKFSK